MRKNVWMTGAMMWIMAGIFPVSVCASQDLITANKGNIIEFGSYEQDGNPGNGAEPIEWIILEKEAGELLLLSRYALDCHEYYIPENENSGKTVTWENCALRAWLADDFCESAFSGKEWTRLITQERENSVRDREGLTAALGVTNDHVTLLSFDELEKYYPEKTDRVTEVTPYALAKGTEEFWWLRTASGEQECYAVRTADGVVGTVTMTSPTLAVRPLVRIRMYQNDSGRVIDCSSPELIKQVQERLNAIGFSCGEADGKLGKATEAAIIRFQAREQLPASGVLNEMTVVALGL